MDNIECHRLLRTVYGMSDNKIEETKKNKKLFTFLIELVRDNNLHEYDKSVGVLLYALATRLLKQSLDHRERLIDYIITKKLTTSQQLNAAFEYIINHDEFINSDFETFCGIGTQISSDEIENGVKCIFDNDENLHIERYRAESRLRKMVMTRFRFANGKLVNDIFNSLFIQRLGPKTPSDGNPQKTRKMPTEYETLPENIEYPPPESNKQVRDELLEHHLAYLKSIHAGVITRFPPEPNGYLHIGHAKSMNLNFGYAKRKKGICYLRFDDTNPAAERQEYIDSILESVTWLGHTPYAVTYASDYFDTLYELGEKFIILGKGYVCECSDDIMREKRQAKEECVHRNRSIEENLKLFREMRDRMHDPGSMTLRMKGDMNSANTTMRDMVAYRILNSPHPRTGSKWCIYPSYDFAHCICDSLENITHSFCTLEFCVRRPAYEWLLHQLDMYCPVQNEFSKMEVNGTVLSKRRLLKLVESGVVNGWDDPRLLTLSGLRRRGYTPEAINQFCNILSITRHEGAAIDLDVLEGCCRKVMDRDAIRLMVVLDPLKIVITNYPDDKTETFTVPNHPYNPEMGFHSISFSKVIYIDRSDFRLEDSESYYRLAPGKLVRLKYGYNIRCTGVHLADTGHIEYIEAEYEDSDIKPAGTIHWVSNPRSVEVRLYDRLFKSKNPSSLDNFLDDINPSSLKIIPQAYLDKMTNITGTKFQFERIGFFSIDPDTTNDKLIFNLTVRDKNIAHEK